MTYHRSKPHPKVGDIWRFNTHVSRNAQGIELTIRKVEAGFGGRGRAYYTGRTAGALSVNDLKWCADFVREGPPPPKALPSKEALATADWLDRKASAWMRGVKEGWTRGDRVEGERKTQEAVWEEDRKAQEWATRSFSELTVDELRALGRKGDFRRRLETFFKTHSPHKLPTLNKCMEKFEDNEERMMLELEEAEAKMVADADLGSALLMMPDAQLGSLLKPIKNT